MTGQYTGRRRAASDDYGSHGSSNGYGNAAEGAGRRLADTNRDRPGVERELAPRNANKPRRPGRRRAPVADSTQPRLSSRLAKAGPLALAMAIGGAVAAFAAPSHASAPQLSPAPQCVLRLPDQPLTAQGLATPFVLSGFGGQPCHEADPNTAAFAQGIVLDPATGQLSVYNPLVIDEGTQAAVDPTVPALPANAVIALWFGFNGNVLALGGNGVNAGSCVNGTDTSPFGQFSYCNAPAFFTAANAAIQQGKLTIPPIGKANDGQSCMTTRDFGLVDQDQSDNVTTTYLALPDGRTAQNTRHATKQLAGQTAKVLANGSDNLLLDHFVDPALGCTPFTAPDLANPGFQATNLALNELQAAANQAAPVAIVPVNDPMVVDGNGAVSNTKTDLYRAGVDQPPLSQADGSPQQYCANLRTLGVTRTKLDRSLTNTTSSPDAGAASNLFTFLAMRLQQSYVNLGCEQLLGERNPVHLKMDGNGLVVDATFDRVGTVPTPSPSASVSMAASASPSPSLSPSASAVASPSPSPSAPASPSAPPVTASTAPAGGGASTSPAAAPPSQTPPSQAPPAPSTPAASSTSQNIGSNDHSNPSPSAQSTAQAGAPGAPKQPTQPAAGKSTTAAAPGGTNGGGTNSGGGSSGAGGGGNAGAPAGGGAAAGTKPIQAITSTPISVAGFERAHAAAAKNPNSALSGPDPMANSGFSIMGSRLFWALGGALLVLVASMAYRRRPRQPKRSRRGVSS